MLRTRREVLRLRRRGLRVSWDVSYTATPESRFNFGGSCQIQRGVLLSLDRAELTLGDDVLIGEYSNLRPYESFIRIGSRVQLAQFVSLIATNHVLDESGMPRRDATDLRPGKHGVVIGDECWLGTNAVVLPGVELGARCVVGAGAVVTHSYPAGTKLTGVPARPR